MPQRTGPIGGTMYQVVLGLARRVRLPALEARYDRTWVLGLFAFVARTTPIYSIA